MFLNKWQTRFVGITTGVDHLPIYDPIDQLAKELVILLRFFMQN